MKLCILLLAIALHLRSDAAVIVTGGSRLSWDFILVGASPGADSIDQFTVQYGPDKLNAGDMVSITVLAKDQLFPIYSNISHGYPTMDLSGLLWSGNWDTAFPTHEGTVIIEVLAGELDLKSITIQLRSLPFSGSASILPAVHLVPEPATCTLMLAASLLLARRRRETT